MKEELKVGDVVEVIAINDAYGGEFSDIGYKYSRELEKISTH